MGIERCPFCGMYGVVPNQIPKSATFFNCIIYHLAYIPSKMFKSRIYSDVHDRYVTNNLSHIRKVLCIDDQSEGER